MSPTSGSLPTSSFLLSFPSEVTTDYTSNDTSTGPHDADFEPGYEAIIVPIVFCIIFVVGCVGNILVIIVVIKNREQFKNTTNLFILNLAVADLLFLTLSVPFHAVIYTAIASWPFGEVMCKIAHLVQYCSMVTSIGTLVAMSLDRFLAVGYPLQTKHLRTPCAALGVCLVIWTIALGAAVPPTIAYTVRGYGADHSVLVCADDWGNDWNRSTYYLVLVLIGYVLPVTLIGAFSALTVRQLWAMEETDGLSQRRSHEAKQRVTKLIIVVVVVFVLCWLPNNIIWLWTNFFPWAWHNEFSYLSLRLFCHTLSYANSSLNPVIYAFLSSRFRRGFKRALCRPCIGSVGGRRDGGHEMSGVSPMGGTSTSRAGGCGLSMQDRNSHCSHQIYRFTSIEASTYNRQTTKVCEEDAL